MQPAKGKGLSSKVSCEERVLRTLGTSYLKGKHMVFRTMETVFCFFPGIWVQLFDVHSLRVL